MREFAWFVDVVDIFVFILLSDRTLQLHVVYLVHLFLLSFLPERNILTMEKLEKVLCFFIHSTWFGFKHFREMCRKAQALSLSEHANWEYSACGLFGFLVAFYSV